MARVQAAIAAIAPHASAQRYTARSVEVLQGHATLRTAWQVGSATGAWKRAHAPQALLTLATRWHRWRRWRR